VVPAELQLVQIMEDRSEQRPCPTPVQAIGVAMFGSLFLTLSTRPGPVVSGQALATTMAWLAAVMVLSVLAGIPLARTVAAARR
jgi:hypothetical protein